MLVLTRKVGERIHIGDDVVLTVVSIKGNQVRLGVQAPVDVKVMRAELLARDRAAAEGREYTGPVAATTYRELVATID